MSNHNEPSSTGSVDVRGKNVLTLTVHIAVFVLGVPGNCLILRVYWPKVRHQATSTTVLILALACADLAACLLRPSRILEEMFIIRGEPVPRSIRVIWALGMIPLSTSVLVTAIIAADRYDCVCRPHSRLLSPRRARMTVAASFLIGLIAVGFPAIISEASGDSTIITRLIIVAFQLIYFLMALVLITVCYSLVYRAIRRHVRVGPISSVQRSGPPKADASVPDQPPSCHRHTEASASKVDDAKKQDDPQSSVRPSQPAALQEGVPPATSKEGPSTTEQQRPRQAGGGQQSQAQRGRAPSLQRKTTRMLFITSVVFLLTWLPYWHFVCLQVALYSHSDISFDFMDVAERISGSLFFNNAVNPLIYGIANRRFRKDCLEVFRKIRRR